MRSDRLSAEQLVEFGKLLRGARGYGDGISTAKVAAALGTSRSTLERWEEGKVSDDPPKRRGLALGYCELVGLNPDEWFGDGYGSGARLAELEALVSAQAESLEEHRQAAQDFRQWTEDQISKLKSDVSDLDIARSGASVQAPPDEDSPAAAKD